MRVLPRRRVARVRAEPGSPAAPLCVDCDPPADPLPADVVLWTGGQRAASPAGPPAWALGGGGGAAADATLRLRGHERVFALGDGAEVGGGERLGATAQVAFQQADYCAWNVRAAASARPLLPFRYQHLGEMLALGADGAAVQLLPLLGGGEEGASLSGPLAALLRRAAYVYRMPTAGQQAAVGLSWLQRGWEELQGRGWRG